MIIRVIDIETTGDFPPQHGVCEIGWCDVTAQRKDLIERPSGWAVGVPGSKLINPGTPMTPETSAIHHLVEEDVRGAEALHDVAPRVLHHHGILAALAAHSAKFERRFITDEMTGGTPWVDTYKCALRLFPDAPSHSNQALRYWRRPVGLVRATAMPAHRAGPDAYVTAFHLRDMLDLAELPDLIKWSAEPALQVTCHIGRQRGMKWREVDIGFLYWLLDKDFDEDVLFTARYEIERREREHPAPVEEEDIDQSAGDQ